MWTVLALVGSLIIGLALLTGIAFLASRYFALPRYPDEVHFARTGDGWRIAVIRHRPVGPSRGEPVLLIHGIAANRYNFDLTDERSLALYLSRSGYDVWMVELRGRGYSTRPRLFSGLHYDWCFDEYVEQDLPAATAAILHATGAQRLHLVGFSTGALAAYAFLTDPHRTTEIASLVSIAGPSSFKRTRTYLSGRLIRNLRWMRHRFLMRVLAPLSGYFHLSPLQLIHNPENLEGLTQRYIMVNLIANFARNELLQYGDWLMNDVFRSLDQRRDYRAELSRLETPTLFLAGSRDLLAPPDAVKATHDTICSPDKRFVICSRAQKFAANYGHFDLLLGQHAPAEIFPLVRDWLAEHEHRQAWQAPEQTMEPEVNEPTIA
ncbi:MAG TPA: alpha/beta hydrolase [Polyangia bacterium]|jgi:pimeloyl-ACP methyl ester carboxylesterase|nr:alpha/beta hydrolase [Polyangia bacterium]